MREVNACGHVAVVLGLTAMLALVSANASAASAQAPLTHVVRPGETLASIAELYYGDPRREGVLVTENGLNSGGGSAIVVGMRLLVPSVWYHKVLEGETWAELATRFYGDPSRAFVLIEANSGKSVHPDVGAELLVPYPLRHIADQNEALRKIAKLYFKNPNGINIISRFNEESKRVVRGQIVLVPLADLVLTKEGKALADKQKSESVEGGDVRQKQAAIDAELPALREHVRGGRYEDALAMANRLIGAGDLTSSHVVSIHREMATALVALDREDLAREALSRMLDEQPDAELDSVRTSPRVLKIFEQAKQAVAITPGKGPEKASRSKSGEGKSRRADASDRGESKNGRRKAARDD
jgi:LysM repeat protein